MQQYVWAEFTEKLLSLGVIFVRRLPQQSCFGSMGASCGRHKQRNYPAKETEVGDDHKESPAGKFRF